MLEAFGFLQCIPLFEVRIVGMAITYHWPKKEFLFSVTSSCAAELLYLLICATFLMSRDWLHEILGETFGITLNKLLNSSASSPLIGPSILSFSVYTRRKLKETRTYVYPKKIPLHDWTAETLLLLQQVKSVEGKNKYTTSRMLTPAFALESSYNESYWT